MPETPDGSPMSRALRAAVHPLSLVIAAGTIAGALLLSPLVIVPGAAAWVASVLLLALRRRAPTEEGPDTSRLPPSLQRDLQGVLAAIDELQAAIAGVSPDQRPVFEDVERQADGLRATAKRIALSAGALHARLADSRPQALEAEREQLRRRLEATRDDAARRNIEASLEAVRVRLQRREELMARLERHRATLRAMQSTAEELADRAARLASGEMALEQMDEQAPARRVEELQASVAALEEVMRTDVQTH